jgi:hypothetical protein
VLQRALDEESGHAAAVLAAERRAARDNARADLDACRAVVTEEALREVRAREAALDRRAEELANWARTSTVAMRRVLARERADRVQGMDRALESGSGSGSGSRVQGMDRALERASDHACDLAEPPRAQGLPAGVSAGMPAGVPAVPAGVQAPRALPGSLSRMIEEVRSRCSNELHVLGGATATGSKA